MAVIVCGTFQLASEKTSVAGSTFPSAVLLLDRSNVTSAEGMLVRWTATLADPPASVVARPEVRSNATPTTSLSVLVIATSAGSMPA